MNENTTGILLISHGSRLPHGSEVINQIADMYREQTNCKIEIGYMEIKKPSIPTAMNNLTKETRIKKVIVVPVFLAHGIHTKNDIPTLLGLETENSEEKNNHHHKHHHHHEEEEEEIEFQGEIILTDPLGSDPRIVEIIQERVNNA